MCDKIVVCKKIKLKILMFCSNNTETSIQLPKISKVHIMKF